MLLSMPKNGIIIVGIERVLGFPYIVLTLELLTRQGNSCIITKVLNKFIYSF